MSRFILAVALATGCTSADPEITEPNALGITSIETSRLDRNGVSTFAVRGLTASGAERARVALRIGAIDEVVSLVGSEGSELVLAIDGVEQRSLSSETQLFHLRARDANARQFLSLTEVSDALADAGILVDTHVRDDIAYDAQGCSPDQLNTSPEARQCCFSPDTTQMAFIRPDGYLSVRYHNPYNVGCRASDGLSSCSGAGCYFGPNGFSRTDLTEPDFTYAWRMEPGYYYGDPGCVPRQYDVWANPPPLFPTLTGTSPLGQNCPGGNDGSGGNWDY